MNEEAMDRVGAQCHNKKFLDNIGIPQMINQTNSSLPDLRKTNFVSNENILSIWLFLFAAIPSFRISRYLNYTNFHNTY
jgi:hypothetical protein